MDGRRRRQAGSESVPRDVTNRRMEVALPRTLLEGLAASEPSVRVEFRADFQEDGLSERELELISPILADLVGELLQMSQDQDTE
jgi:hypothetical protein